MRPIIRGATLVALALPVPFACGSSGDGAAGETGASTGSDGGIVLDASIGPGADGGVVVFEDGQACAAEVMDAELVDIDLFIMLDSSGSMLEMVAGGGTKWTTIVDALVQFTEQPGTEDIGIGVQFFPHRVEGTPQFCDTNDQCGAAGPCASTFCVAEEQLPNVTIYHISDASDGSFCSNDGDCSGAGEVCKQVVGVCVLDDQVISVGEDDNPLLLVCTSQGDCPVLDGAPSVCEEIGACEFLAADGGLAPCTVSLACPAELGECFAFPYTCVNETLCETSEYAAPAVSIGAGANRNDDIAAALTAREPEGFTPTGPALAGAIDYAREWSADNPGRKVVAVLATDGLPTDCAPTDIAQVAAIAADGVDGAPRVDTYVVGVFAPQEAAVAQTNLNEIAEAGGSGDAFIVTTGGDVAEQFLSALNEIREAALACDFAIPESSDGLDLNFVNLQFTDGDGEITQLFNVENEGGCERSPDTGWFFLDETGAGVPTRISVCPEVCDAFRASSGGQVSLQIGCSVMVR